MSGRLSDRVGSRLLTPIGLSISALGLLGLTTINQFTPYWLLAVYMDASSHLLELVFVVPKTKQRTTETVARSLASVALLLHPRHVFSFRLLEIQPRPHYKYTIAAAVCRSQPRHKMTNICTAIQKNDQDAAARV